MICFPVRIKAAILRRLVCRTFSSVDGNADALKLILGLFHFFAREMHREQRKIDVEKVALLFLLARLNKLDSLQPSSDSLKHSGASWNDDVASVKRDVALLVQNIAHDWKRHCRCTATEMFGRNYAVPSVIKSITGLCKRFVEATEPSEQLEQIKDFSDKVVDELIARVCLFESFESRVVCQIGCPSSSFFYFQDVPMRYCRALLQRISNADNVDTDVLSAKIANNQLKGKELAEELGRLSGQLINSDCKTDLLDLKVHDVWPPFYVVTLLCSSSIFFFACICITGLFP